MSASETIDRLRAERDEARDGAIVYRERAYTAEAEVERLRADAAGNAEVMIGCADRLRAASDRASRAEAEAERLRAERDALLALCRAYHLNAQAHAWAELGGPRPSWAHGDDAEGAWAQYSALVDDLQAALPDALGGE